MPLISLCGYPSAGKSRRAADIKAFFEGKGHRVHWLQEVDDRRVFASIFAEKKTRGALMSSVERVIGKHDIVICDGLNYIKGYRYQLYCVAKEAATAHCVVFCDVPAQTARQWNADRIGDRYEPETLDDLITRFEEPLVKNRWDSPLVIVQAEDETPCQLIFDSVMSPKKVVPHAATLSAPPSSSDLLSQIDKITQQIIHAILDAQKHGSSECCAPNVNAPIELKKPVTLAELRRYKRQYITMNKHHQITDAKSIAETFADYLTTIFGIE